MYNFNSCRGWRVNFPRNFDMYVSHLNSLNLIRGYHAKPQEDVVDSNKEQVGTLATISITLSDFGTLFTSACV
jgi:hypothetical protein